MHADAKLAGGGPSAHAPSRRVASFFAILRSTMPSVRGFLPLFVLLVVWELLSVNNPSPYLPPPSAWWEELGRWYGESLWANVIATVQTFVLGLLIATALGTVLGIAIGTLPLLRRSLSTLLEFLRTLPAPTIIPIVLLLFGPGEGTKLFAVVFAAIWPILLNTASGASQVTTTLVDVSRVFHLSRWAYVGKVALPAAVPHVLIGVRVAVPIALIVTILIEMLVSTPGLGRDLMHAQRTFRSASAFGLLFVVGFLGYFLNVGFLLLQRLILRRWPQGAEA